MTFPAMKRIKQAFTTVLLLLSGLQYSSVNAGDYLNFSQYPVGAGYRPPAPNVIVSVDDSSSMGSWGMDALKAALRETFQPSNVPDWSIRLAFMSLNQCNTIPHTGEQCEGLNYMQPLYGKADPNDNSPRGRFLNWVNRLTYNGGTPTHNVVHSAGEYLRTTGIHSPWNSVPGKADNQPLACRKAYHVLMTDGGWNAWSDTPSLTGTRTADESFDNTYDNVDGSPRILPDGTFYDPTSPQTRVYADQWGRQAVDGSLEAPVSYLARGDDGYKYWSMWECQQYTKNCANYTDLEWRTMATPLSDVAFHYWATDLQPNLPNEVKPIIRHSGEEVFTVGNRSQALSEYWNPRNNPATWQHMIHYTIGFNAAARWPTLPTDPVFGTNTFDGDFPKLVLGDKYWGNMLQPPMHPSLSEYYKFYLNPHSDVTFSASVYPEDVRQQEMWHMAINSRGKFVPAPTSADLVNAFKDLVSSIVMDHSAATTNYATASSSVSMRGTVGYASFYEANGWQGGVRSYQLAERTASMSPNPAWGINTSGQGSTTADKLDDLTETQLRNRLILTHNGQHGVPFLYDQLSTVQKDWLSRTNHSSNALDQNGNNRLQYLRGSRTQEGQMFRQRNSRHGDIVHSTLWHIGAPNLGLSLPGYTDFSRTKRNRLPMLYVGANDGMLHGFSAVDGTERLAYVPQGVYPFLSDLTHPSYGHRYYVDGSPFTGDVFINELSGAAKDKWRTYLVGTLGAGGKGFFVLDVTSPGSTSGETGASNFTAANASTLVVMDKTASDDPDLGHIFGEPVVDDFNPQHSLQIVQLNNGRWAVILGNGYNSTNEAPVLLVQYLDGQKELLKIAATRTGSEAQENGLSTPRTVDINGDGKIDVVYAGDMRGNLWKFNLLSKSDSNWSVAFGGSPLFTASYETSVATAQPPAVTVRQPITTAPMVRINTSVGGVMVAFGTGRNLTQDDPTSASQQSFYSVLDNTHYSMATTGADQGTVQVAGEWSTISTGRAALQRRSFHSDTITDTVGDASYWNMPESSSTTNAPIDYANGQRGWYLDFPETGERVIRNPRIYVAGSAVIEIMSDSPSSGGNVDEERCDPPSLATKSWRTLMGFEFGLAPNQQIIDINADNVYSLTSDQRANRMSAPSAEMRLRSRGEQIRLNHNTSTRLADLARPIQTMNWRQFR